MKKEGRYYVYITTNQHRTTLYTGATNDLTVRPEQHKADALFGGRHFAGKYQSFYLIYYEEFGEVLHAIAREKEIKGWSREKKLQLIRSINPELKFLDGDEA